MVRTNQGGSVLGFIVVGVVLVALFVGGAYTVHQLIAQPDQSTPVQPENPSPKPDNSKNDSAKKPQQKSDDKQSQPSQTPANNNPAPQQSSSAELPQTGPAQLLGSLFAITLLTGAAVSYMRSRRPELSL